MVAVMRHTQISVDVHTYESLWQSKERFRKLSSEKPIWTGKLTWGDFLEQAVTILESRYSLLPSVDAERLNPYVYRAECPNCGTEKYPLRRRRKIAWKIKCSGCGKEYIALV